MTSKRRYVVVGTGHRVRMYLDAMAGDHRDDAELVGLIEPNPGRLAVHLDRLAEAGLDIDRHAHRAPDELERVIEQDAGRPGDHHLARLHPRRADRPRAATPASTWWSRSR